MAHGDITHIDIPAADKAAQTEFYGAIFGWQIAEHPGYPGYPMWQAPNKVSGGGFETPSENFTHPRPNVEVDSIDDVVAEVVARGGAVVVPKSPISETSWWAVITDPEGYQMGVYQGSEPDEA